MALDIHNALSYFILCLSIPFLYISPGINKLDGMVNDTSMSCPYVLF